MTNLGPANSRPLGERRGPGTSVAHLRECRPDEGWCAEGCPRYPMIESALRPPESPAAQCCDKVYFCPTSGETECPVHGGFDVCCDRPDLHRPVASAAQGRYKRLIGDLYAAEEAARQCERERNEGDADAIRRDAIRSALKLGFTDGSLPLFADLWKRHE